MKRVAITGAGAINALGHDVSTTLTALREGRCGIGLLDFRIPYRDSNIHLLDMKASGYYLPYLLGPSKGAVRRSA